MAQTNNGPGDAWLGKRNRDGTPQQDSLSKTNPPLWNEKWLSSHVGKCSLWLKAHGMRKRLAGVSHQTFIPTGQRLVKGFTLRN